MVSGKELVPVKEGLEEDGAHPQQGGDGAAGVWLLFLRPWYSLYCSLDRRHGW